MPCKNEKIYDFLPILTFFVNTFCRSNKTFLNYGNMFVSYQKMVINKYSELVDIYSIYVLYGTRKQFCTESSFPNCSFKTGLGFEPMLSTYILYA